jgi:hypothetical protein
MSNHPIAGAFCYEDSILLDSLRVDLQKQINRNSELQAKLTEALADAADRLETGDVCAAKYNRAVEVIDDLQTKLAAVLGECDEKSTQLRAANATACEFATKLAAAEVLLNELERLRQLEIDLRGLIKDSDGVAGLHLNGDLAPWSELVPGGNFGIWLAHFKEREDE